VYFVGASGRWQASLALASWLSSWTWTWWGYSHSGWRSHLDWGLCFCLGSRSGGVHGRIRGDRRGYGAHGRSGGFAVNKDLLGVLVGLKEGD
jgi:hypothetical protein